MTQAFQDPSIGSTRELLQMFKIKDSAVHAGLSQLLLLSKVTTSSLKESLLSFLSSNLLIAPVVHTAIKVAMVET